MNDTLTNKLPKLLKERITHSRIFAGLVLLVFLFNAPASQNGGLTAMLFSWAGLAFVILGAFGRAYCSLFIGGRKNNELVREGPFSVVRNPLYVFSFIAVVGIGLQSGVLLLLLVLMGAFVFYYPVVVKKEEAFLVQKFGAPYETYIKEVPRWIPDMKLWAEPETTISRPKFVRKTFMDASIFFVPMLFFQAHAALHANGILPTWFNLP
jgi:protein-S-isoprenylcysteine O-methyltransferase Ste14